MLTFSGNRITVLYFLTSPGISTSSVRWSKLMVRPLPRSSLETTMDISLKLLKAVVYSLFFLACFGPRWYRGGFAFGSKKSGNRFENNGTHSIVLTHVMFRVICQFSQNKFASHRRDSVDVFYHLIRYESQGSRGRVSYHSLPFPPLDMLHVFMPSRTDSSARP